MVIFGARSGMPLKPNPQSTLEVIKQMNIDAHEIAFVGDGDTDIKTALGAGIHPIAVTWGLRSVEELTQVGAKTFIDKPLELLEYI
jgi:phosphoglycolate phosphatase